jgi:hypothetical protein
MLFQTSSPNARRQGKSAFTLIELLVVRQMTCGYNQSDPYWYY